MLTFSTCKLEKVDIFGVPPPPPLVIVVCEQLLDGFDRDIHGFEEIMMKTKKDEN